MIGKPIIIGADFLAGRKEIALAIASSVIFKDIGISFVAAEYMAHQHRPIYLPERMGLQIVPPPVPKNEFNFLPKDFFSNKIDTTKLALTLPPDVTPPLLHSSLLPSARDIIQSQRPFSIVTIKNNFVRIPDKILKDRDDRQANYPH